MKTQTIKSIGFALLACLILFAACNKDEDPLNEEGSVTFSMEEVNKNLKSTINQEQFKNLLNDPEDADKFVISIDNEFGTEVKSSEELEVHNFNGQFVSDPISLLTGDYFLTEFLVKDDSGNVIFATPMEGSEKAYLVDDPLAIAFTVNKDQVTQVVPEVLDTEESVPDDFGYNSYSFEVVETFDFLVSVLVFDENMGDWVLTDAIIEVEAAGNIIFQDTILSQTEKITVNDGYSNYMVSIIKDGYYAVDSTFTNAALKAYFNEPLLIKLFAADTTGNGQGTVTDYDGNVYQTVQIGNQVWMAENLATTHYNDGEGIPNVTDGTEWANLSTPAFCWYLNDSTVYKDRYGTLYNWWTVETGKLCPIGWHVPSDDEWKELEMFIGMSYGDAYDTGWRGADEGDKLKMRSKWNNNDSITNAYDFSAIPTGIRDGGAGDFFDEDISGAYWRSSSEASSYGAWVRGLSHDTSLVNRAYHNKQDGYSVRCVKDD